MPTSPRLKIPYPDVNTDPWFDNFVSMVNSVDGSLYAGREDRNIVVMGGGTLTWNQSISQLSWSADIELYAPNSGYLWRVPIGNATILDGQVLYLTLVRAPQANTNVVATVGNYVPNDVDGDSQLLLCVRRGNNLHFRDGYLMVPSDSYAVFDSHFAGGGGGSTVAVQNNGVAVSGSPFTTVNFAGTNFTTGSVGPVVTYTLEEYATVYNLNGPADPANITRNKAAPFLNIAGGVVGAVHLGYNSDSNLAHTISGDYGTIGGGDLHTVSGNYGTIPGGHLNVAGAYACAWGEGNTASGSYSTCGGNGNYATSGSATALGSVNSAYGGSSTCLGSYNVTNGVASIATGTGASAPRLGQSAHASGYFTAQGDAQHTRTLALGLSSNATSVRLAPNNTSSPPNDFPLANEKVYALRVTCLANQIDDITKNAVFVYDILANCTGGTATILNSNLSLVYLGTTTYTFTITASGAELVFTFTGDSGVDVRAVATIEATELGINGFS